MKYMWEILVHLIRRGIMNKQKVAVVIACAFYLTLVGVVHANSLENWEAAISAANPLHWYKFNETADNDCIDSSSGMLNGTYDGPMPGQVGLFSLTSAAVFSWILGTDRVNFPGATNVDGPWTAEYIVMRTTLGQGAMVLHDSDTTSIFLAGPIALREVGFRLYGVADWEFTPSAGYTRKNLIAPLNEWIHLVFRRDNSGTQVFVNGELVGTTVHGVDFPRLRIGAAPANYGLESVLDEAVIYNRPLSDEDILAHAKIVEVAATNAQRTNPPPSPTSADVLVIVESPDITALINGIGGGIATLLSDGEATGLTVARITTVGSWGAGAYHLPGAPPAGRYRFTLRARMASGQGPAIPVVIGNAGESIYYYRSTGMLDFSNMSPDDGFVVRSCDLDLLMPGTTPGYWIRVWLVDNMDVDWYMLEPLPESSSAPVEVVQAQTEKLFYTTNSNAVAQVRLLNTSSIDQVAHLRIWLESGLADSRIACDTSVAVPASGIPELFSFPVGKLAAGGTAVIAEILDDGEQVVSTARDYALSGDSPVDVSPLFDNFIGQHLPPYDPTDAALEILPARLKYAALTELDFWAPCDTTMLTAPPGYTTWWSGQTLKRFSVEQLHAYMQVAEAQGIGVVAYADYSVTYGWRVLEAARKQPEILEWDVSNAGGPLFAFNMSADGAAPLDSKQRREDDNEWQSTSADGVARVIMSSHAMLKLHADQLVASMKQFGWLGFRYDDPLEYNADQIDIFGRQGPFGGWSNEAMIRYIRDRIAAQNPEAVYGHNADPMRVMSGYLDTPGKATQSATEAAILRGKGGFLLQEAFRDIFRTKRRYEDIRDHYLTGGRNAKAGEGHLFAIVDMGNADNDGDREYVGALAGAAGVQLAYSPSTTPYMQFLARYSGLLFGKRVQPVGSPTALVKVDAGADGVWWSDYVYCHYVGAGHRQYIVHLINPPATTNIGDTVSSPEPPALANVVVSFTLPAGWIATNAALLTPDGRTRGRSFFEGIDYLSGSGGWGYNIISEASAKTPTNQPLPLAGDSVTVPEVAKWSIVVLDCLGPVDDLPNGPTSILPTLPSVPDVNQPEIATMLSPTSTHLLLTIEDDFGSSEGDSETISDPLALNGKAQRITTNYAGGSLYRYCLPPTLGIAGRLRFTVRVRTETMGGVFVLSMSNSGEDPVHYYSAVSLDIMNITPAQGYCEFTNELDIGETLVNMSINLENLWPGLVIDSVKVERISTETDSVRLGLRGETAWPGSVNVPDYIWRQDPRIWFANGLYHEYFKIKEALQAVAPAAQVSFGDPYLYGSDNRGWNGNPFPGTPAALMENNLVILADVPANNNGWPTSNSNGLAWLDWLRGYVEKGGRVLLTGGPFGFGRGAWNSDLVEPMLPVTLAPRAATGLGYDLHPVPGSAAPLQPVGPLADGLDWNTPAQVFWLHQATVRPGAAVQATAGGLPAIVTRTYGTGRMAVVLAAPLGEPSAGQTAFWDAPQWQPLMSNVVNWLLAPDSLAGPEGN